MKSIEHSIFRRVARGELSLDEAFERVATYYDDRATLAKEDAILFHPPPATATRADVCTELVNRKP